MHFDATVTLGNLLTLIILLGWAFRLDRLLSKYLVEHEILINWYCESHGISPKDLPTRTRG